MTTEQYSLWWCAMRQAFLAHKCFCNDAPDALQQTCGWIVVERGGGDDAK